MTFALRRFLKILPATTLVMAACFLMSMSDTIVCGRIVGEEGLAAINLLLGVFEIVTFASLLVSNGTSALYSSELGASRPSKAAGYYTQGLLIAITLGILLGAGCLIFRVPLLSSYGVSERIYTYASDYLIIFAFSALLEPSVNYLSMMCYADGGTTLVGAALFVQVAVNLVASYLLTRVYGPAGAALGTILAQLVSLGILVFHFRLKICSLRFSRDFAWRGIHRIFGVSIGDASKNMCRAFLMYLLSMVVIAEFGEQYLPVLMVVALMIGFSEVFDGISIAFQPLISVYYGERNTRLIRRVMRLAVRVSLIEGLLVSLFCFAFPEQILDLAALDDPALVPHAILAVRLSAIMMTGLALTLLFNSYYAYVHYEGLATVVTLLSMLVVPGVVAPLGGWLFGLNGLWVALGLAPFMALGLVAVYIVLRYGVRRLPFLLASVREKNQYAFDLALTPQQIARTARSVRATLEKTPFNPARVARAVVLLETFLLVVRQHNASERVFAEVSLDLNDDAVLMLVRDDGDVFDLTDTDAAVASLDHDVASLLLTQIRDREHLVVSGYNRHTFRI